MIQNLSFEGRVVVGSGAALLFGLALIAVLAAALPMSRPHKRGDPRASAEGASDRPSSRVRARTYVVS
jgi:hypothetical protein